MIAWTQDRYGGPETLSQEHVAVAEPGPGEVRLQVNAAGLNSADLRLMRGRPYLVRLGFGIRRPRARIPGRDVAGTVAAVGPGVALQLGQRVVGELPSAGGLAEQVIAPAELVVPIPDEVTDPMAAALPLAGGTAWQGLDLADVGAGSRVLILGAGGGVGTFAVRLAVLRGARVQALCRAKALAAVSKLGAELVTDRAHGLDELPADSFDAVLDLGGKAPLASLQRLIRPGGVVVAVAVGDQVIRRLLGTKIRSLGSKRPIRPLLAATRPALTQELLALVASGELEPVIETLPLADAPAGLTKLESGAVIGKLVLIPGS